MLKGKVNHATKMYVNIKLMNSADKLKYILTVISVFKGLSCNKQKKNWQ